MIKDINIVVPETIFSIEMIQEILKYASEQMSEKVNGNDIDSITEKMEELLSLMPSIADCHSSAVFWLKAMKKEAYKDLLEQIKNKEVPEEFKGFDSPSVLKDYIDSLIADYYAIEKKAERTSANLSRYIDTLRSMMSKEKELINKTK